MTALPEPLTPAECDLRGMPYMPVELVRLFDSELYILSTGDEFKAAFTLWGKAFLQTPAGSLPADDRLLAHLSGAGVRWPKVKAMALRGWIECGDGRLYHPVVAQKAIEAWETRLAQRARTEAARAARAGKRQASGNDTPPTATSSVTENVTDDATADVTASKGREGKGREKEEPPLPPAGGGSAGAERRGARTASGGLAGFEDWWRLYPRKVGKGAARKAWPRAVREAGGAETLLMALKVAIGLGQLDMRDDGRYCPHGSTWLNGERWLDGVEPDPEPEPAARRLPFAGEALH